MITYYIKLYQCIIAAPRPYSIASFRFGQCFRAILHHIIFYQSTIATSQNNTVTRHSIQYILPDDYSQIRIPLLPDPVPSKLNSISLAIFQIAILNSHSNKSIQNTVIIPAILDTNSNATTFLYHRTSIYIVHIQVINNHIM